MKVVKCALRSATSVDPPATRARGQLSSGMTARYSTSAGRAIGYNRNLLHYLKFRSGNIFFTHFHSVIKTHQPQIEMSPSLQEEEEPPQGEVDQGLQEGCRQG